MPEQRFRIVVGVLLLLLGASFLLRADLKVATDVACSRKATAFSRLRQPIRRI